MAELSSPTTPRFTDEELAQFAAGIVTAPTPEWYIEQGICPFCRGMGGSYHTDGCIKTFARDCQPCEGTGRV